MSDHNETRDNMSEHERNQETFRREANMPGSAGGYGLPNRAEMAEAMLCAAVGDMERMSRRAWAAEAQARSLTAEVHRLRAEVKRMADTLAELKEWGTQ